MSGLQLAVAQQTLVAFVLAAARTAGFVLLAPPFNTRTVPGQAKAALVIGLALPLTDPARAQGLHLGDGALVWQLILQVATGVALGWLVLAAVATLQSAGDLLDVVGGFTLSQALDPMLMAQTSVMGRLHTLTAATLLFVTDGHLMVLAGLTRSIEVAPGGLHTTAGWAGFSAQAVAALASLVVGALQIAAPVVAAMLVADLALGLLTRAAPALNAFSLSYPLKVLFTLLLAGLAITRLPQALHEHVDHVTTTVVDVATRGR